MKNWYLKLIYLIGVIKKASVQLQQSKASQDRCPRIGGPDGQQQSVSLLHPTKLVQGICCQDLRPIGTGLELHQQQSKGMDTSRSPNVQSRKKTQRDNNHTEKKHNKDHTMQ